MFALSWLDRTRRIATPARTVAGIAMLCIIAVSAIGQPAARRGTPTRLTDAEFWRFFTTMSEESGTFPSENFVSNEVSFQHPIPTLQRTTTPGGVYLGVGPEQNYTYIANLKPAMAVIFDIRRQNAMVHLMYKALFEMSPTRAAFVDHLFARPLPAGIPATIDAAQLFETVRAAPKSDVAAVSNADSIIAILTKRHGFDMNFVDVATIRRVYQVFVAGGPAVNYSWRSNPGGAASGSAQYVSYELLQTATNLAGVNMAFLGSDDAYQQVRSLHLANLIIPVVGDFAGPKAIRNVGGWLKDHQATVQAFYLSNVEQYLFQNGVSDRFYANVATLPLDSTSTFIRSVPPGTGTVVNMQAQYTIITLDSMLVKRVVATTTSRDTARVAVRPPPIPPVPPVPPVPPTMIAQGASPSRLNAYNVLVSGISGIMATIKAYEGGIIRSYSELGKFTKTDGW